MTGLIPNDLKQAVKNQCAKIEKFKRILSEDEIKEKIVNCVAFYRDPNMKGLTYNDKSRDWIFIETPEKEVGADGVISNKPKEVNSEYSTEPIYMWRCTFPLGQITIFATQSQIVQMGWNSISLITGKLRTRYGVSNNYYSSLEEVAKALNIPSIKDISDDLYVKYYSINVYQVIK